MRPSSLSISSNSSQSSTSSSRSISPHASPRRGLLAAASSRSPGLPALNSRLDRRSRSRSKRSLLSICGPPYRRVVVSTFGLLVLTFVLLKSFVSEYHRSKELNYDLVDQAHLPEDPAAIIVHDNNAQTKWTIWIPPHEPFPLRPWEYAEICAQSEEVQRELGSGSLLFGSKKKSYYSLDPNFVDVKDALSSGLLPSSPTLKDQLLNDDYQLGHKRTCERSLTFVMATDDAGMGNSLLALWLAYGLARKEERAFFVDDTSWPYGNYSSYFKPPPDPGCKPPPPNYRVPCPRSASHLVISYATFPFAYGRSFLSEFLDTSKPPGEQHHRIFDLMRSGYESLFHLADAGDASYLQQRTSGKLFQEAKAGGGTTIGLHVRRGDVHPWEREFENDYLPLMRYMSEVREILIKKYEHDDNDNDTGEGGDANHSARTADHQTTPKARSNPFSNLTPFTTFGRFRPIQKSSSGSSNDLRKRHGPAGMMASKLLLASDDPLVYAAPEVSRAVRAQDRVVLASKVDLENMLPGSQRRPGRLDTLHGWEGGFFRSEFFSLGVTDAATRVPPKRSVLRGRTIESPEHARFANALYAASASLPANDPWHGGVTRISMPPPSPQAFAMRALVGRSYLLDLAVLGKTDAVVCAVSSAACRVLGVMVGWEGVVGGAWINVDGNFGWQGLAVG